MEQPPAPAPSGPTVPKLSTTVLLAMGAIATIVLVAIFAYILFVAPALRIDERLWWTGLTSMVFAVGSHELVDVPRKAALLDLLFHFLEDEDALVRRRVGAEQLVRAAPMALPLLFDRLLQLVCIELPVAVQIVAAHAVLKFLVILSRLHRVADHERPEARRLRVGPGERQPVRNLRQGRGEQVRVPSRGTAVRVGVVLAG